MSNARNRVWDYFIYLLTYEDWPTRGNEVGLNNIDIMYNIHDV